MRDIPYSSLYFHAKLTCGKIDIGQDFSRLLYTKMSITTTARCEVSEEQLQAIEMESIVHPPPCLNSKSLERRPETQRPEEELASEPLTSTGVPPISKWKATVIIGTVACVGLMGSMLGGI